jgi:ATP-dependent helicase HrpA/adenine-specific DNA-methyltransferase
LREDSTFPERLLWGKLRAGRLAGLKFRRQYPLGAYIADFYCHDSRLAIELDGDSHVGRAAYDRHRTANISESGIRVMRVANDDVIAEMDAVLTAILFACGIDPDKAPGTQ